ncbi:MAG: transcriptional regulator [Thermodesulfobacteriota bacterium]|nr:transcriptional regulator [Thermodesulfobacteriota bacterium]
MNEAGLQSHEKTVRQYIVMLLSEKDMNVRELSQAAGIREKDVYGHLSHISRSIANKGQKLIVQPFCCLVCGYVFKNRKRFNCPSRCPNCKGEHLQRPTYRIT